jgi:hypothetical protein
MSSVITRVREIKQPYGGYVRMAQFDKIKFDDGLTLKEGNVSPVLTGLAVDYLTRFMSGLDVALAFDISHLGYWMRIEVISTLIAKGQMWIITNSEKEYFGYEENEEDYDDVEYKLKLEDTTFKIKKSFLEQEDKNKESFKNLSSQIKGLDDESITAACKLCTYDVWFRNTKRALASNPPGPKDINPNKEAIEKIRIMVNRTLNFFKTYGPIIVSGFTFGPKGYTKTVDSGDGDFLTKDTLWDLKALSKPITSQNTLQIVMYWIMGKHSGKEEFKNINKIGIFNPKLHIAYVLETSKISKEVIEEIENNVICY